MIEVLLLFILSLNEMMVDNLFIIHQIMYVLHVRYAA